MYAITTVGIHHCARCAKSFPTVGGLTAHAIDAHDVLGARNLPERPRHALIPGTPLSSPERPFPFHLGR